MFHVLGLRVLAHLVVLQQGLVRLGDAAVTEVEPFPDIGALIGPSLPKTSQSTMNSSENRKGSFRRSLVNSFDGQYFRKGPAWLPLIELAVPRMSAPLPDPVQSSSRAHKHKTPETICFITRGRTTQVFPVPLPIQFDGPHTITPPLSSFTWQYQPSIIKARLQLPAGQQSAVVDPSVPVLQLIGFGEHGLEIQEASLAFLKAALLAEGKGKYKATPADDLPVVRAFADVGGAAGFLCLGGEWNKPARSSPLRTSSSLASFSSSPNGSSDNVNGTMGRAEESVEGMFGWAQKGVEDYRVFYLGDGENHM